MCVFVFVIVMLWVSGECVQLSEKKYMVCWVDSGPAMIYKSLDVTFIFGTDGWWDGESKVF